MLLTAKREMIQRSHKAVYYIAGHRGKGTGAYSKTTQFDEGEHTIALRDALASDMLERCGIKVHTDHDTDALATVVSKMKKVVSRQDICLDLHFNSVQNESVNGTEIFIPNRWTSDERELAEELQLAICACLGTKNRGVRVESQGQYQSLAMLSGFDCCNLLLEVCFIGNQKDVQSYLDNREKLVTVINDIVYKHLKR